MTQALESFCPGACLIDYHLRPQAWPPSFITMAQTAHGFGRIRAFGTDDHDPVRIRLAQGDEWYEPPLYGDFTHLPAVPFEDEYGDRFAASELDLRDAVKPGDLYGGRGEDDWIIKQVHDLVRSDLFQDTRRVAVPCLYGSPDWTSPERFLTAAAAAADPIRGALAVQLRSTGAGGVFDRKRQAAGVQTLAAEASARRRCELPADIWFVQNSFLRLAVVPGRRGVELWHDPQASAHYDNDSLAMRITKALFPARPDWRWRRCEIGPVMASIQAVDTHDAEMLRIEMHPDSPYLLVHCAGAMDFDLGPAEEVSLENQIAELSDPQGTLPDRFLFALSDPPLHLPTDRPGRLVISPEDERPRTVALGLAGRTYVTDLAALRTALQRPQQLEGLLCPVVRAVPLSEPPDGPVWVRERRRWVARAAQQNLRDDQRFWVKVVAEPQQTPEVMSHGMLFGTVGVGPGWDYLIALRDVHGQDAVVELTAAVLARISHKFSGLRPPDCAWQRNRAASAGGPSFSVLIHTARGHDRGAV